MEVSVQIYKHSNQCAESQIFDEVDKAKKYARKALDTNNEYFKASIAHEGAEETIWSYRSILLQKSDLKPFHKIALLSTPETSSADICELDMRLYGKLFKYAEIFNLFTCATYYWAVAYYDEESNRWVDTDVVFEDISEAERRAIIHRNTMTDYGHDK